MKIKKKYIAFAVVFLIAVTVYALLFHKNKTLKYIPENADVVVLVDVKNVTRQYISDLIMHPSQWFSSDSKNKNRISLNKSGMKIPDFVQIFHLKNTRLGDWYTVFELKDADQFSEYLLQHKFIRHGRKMFVREGISVSIEGKICIIGTSNSALKDIGKLFLSDSKQNFMNAGQLIENSSGSISYISGKKITNFAVHLNDDDIEIKNSGDSDEFASLISKLQQRNQFLDLELDGKNVENGLQFINKELRDSLKINHFKATAELEEVSDTIISYAYDDDFNEIEKVNYQKIIQPNFIISFQSLHSAKTWKFLQNKKRIDGQNQLTAIPVPNRIVVKGKEIVIQSTRKPLKPSSKQNGNYIFLKNNKLFSSAFHQLTATQKNILSDIDYIFYGNKSQNYFMKIKLKENELPLLLR